MGRAISTEVVYSISATKNTYKAVINYQNKLLNKEGVVRYVESVLHVMEFDEEFCYRKHDAISTIFDKKKISLLKIEVLNWSSMLIKQKF